MDAGAQIGAPHLPGWTPITQEPVFAPFLAGGPGAAPAPTPAPIAPVAPIVPRRPVIDVPDGRRARRWGWSLLGGAAFFLLMVPLMALDASAEPGAWMGGLMMTVMCGIPGALLLGRGRRAGARHRLVAWIATRDRIPVAEVARRMGCSEPDAEALVSQLDQEHGLGLLFVAAERQFVVRGLVAASAPLPLRCPSCGAPTEAAVVLAGERPRCTYCGAPLA